MPLQSLMKIYSFEEMKLRGESWLVFCSADMSHGVSQLTNFLLKKKEEGKRSYSSHLLIQSKKKKKPGQTAFLRMNTEVCAFGMQEMKKFLDFPRYSLIVNGDRMQIENVEDLQLNQISIFYSEKG